MTRHFFSLLLLSTAACISLPVGQKAPEKAKTVHYVEPGNSYSQVTLEDVDKAWRNRDNGGTISYKSSCGEINDPSLTFLQRSLLEGLQNVSISRNERITFNGREALRALVDGSLDGVKTRMDVLIFKKNQCSYTLTYVTLPENFESDKAAFDRFVKGFGVP